MLIPASAVGMAAPKLPVQPMVIDTHHGVEIDAQRALIGAQTAALPIQPGFQAELAPGFAFPADINAQPNLEMLVLLSHAYSQEVTNALTIGAQAANQVAADYSQPTPPHFLDQSL